MREDLDRVKRTSSGLLRRSSRALSMGAFGELVGRIIALYVSDSVVSDEMIAHGAAALFGLVGTFDFGRLRSLFAADTDEGRRLRNCLDTADRLFVDGYISQQEMLEMRKNCLARHAREVSDGAG